MIKTNKPAERATAIELALSPASRAISFCGWDPGAYAPGFMLSCAPRTARSRARMDEEDQVFEVSM